MMSSTRTGGGSGLCGGAPGRRGPHPRWWKTTRFRRQDAPRPGRRACTPHCSSRRMRRTSATAAPPDGHPQTPRDRRFSQRAGPCSTSSTTCRDRHPEWRTPCRSGVHWGDRRERRVAADPPHGGDGADPHRPARAGSNGPHVARWIGHSRPGIRKERILADPAETAGDRTDPHRPC